MKGDGEGGGTQTIKKKILKPIFFLAYVLEGLKEVSPAPIPYALKNYFLENLFLNIRLERSNLSRF